MSMFEDKGLKLMLMAENNDPFDDPNYIYELKHDGHRGVAYLDPEGGSDLRNKRDMKLLPQFPELAGLHRQVRRRCILDGEVIVTGADGKPDFDAIQRRSLMSSSTKIAFAAARQPATFVAFDILFLGDEAVNFRPLMERKVLLSETVREGGRLAVSRYIEEKGTALYQLAEAQGLEGIVAKRKDSKYFFGKTTRDWLKIKYLKDDDYVICGYIRKSGGVTSLILGQYDTGRLVYKGHVTLGVGGQNFRQVAASPRQTASPFSPIPKGNDGAVWIEPLVGVVSYMPGNNKEGLRQAVFKGVRSDKAPEDCKANH